MLVQNVFSTGIYYISIYKNANYYLDVLSSHEEEAAQVSSPKPRTKIKPTVQHHAHLDNTYTMFESVLVM